MAGRPPKVDHIKNDFLRKVDSAINLVVTVRAMEGINPRLPNKLHSQHVRRIVELAFMGVVASWEEYLELIFVRYLAGSITQNGFTPVFKAGKANNLPHAYRILSGNSRYDPSKDYLKFSDPKWVADKADFFFERGQPFDCIRNFSERLQDASSIRNRVAHSSEKCRDEFKKVAIKFIQPASGNLTQGYRSGDLLLDSAVRHFGQQAIQNNWSFFIAYMENFKALAHKLVP